MANEKIVELTSDNFSDTVGQGTVLVDFWAAWCGPCRMVAPVLDELADDFDGQVRIAKVDIDSQQALAAQFQVQSIPTFILFENGEPKDRVMGALPKSAFENFLNKNLAVA